MLKKLTSIVLAGLIVAATLGASSQTAEARGGRIIGGIAAGIIAGTLLSTYAHAHPRYYSYRSYAPSCYKGPRQCDWAGGGCWINRWGERVCSRGEWRCWRPTYCD